MKAATIQEIKLELKDKSTARLVELCLRLARYKKENKELLTFLLFESQNEDAYISGIKEQIDEGFSGMNMGHIYLAKKTIRKVLRVANKFIRFSGSKAVEVEILIYFCEQLKASGLKFHKSNAMNNLYNNQVKKIKLALETMHEDLRHDYEIQINSL